eukprot:3571353-Rhodomonas_salina.4
MRSLCDPDTDKVYCAIVRIACYAMFGFDVVYCAVSFQGPSLRTKSTSPPPCDHAGLLGNVQSNVRYCDRLRYYTTGCAALLRPVLTYTILLCEIRC